jgi:Virulence-associated protein E
MSKGKNVIDMFGFQHQVKTETPDDTNVADNEAPPEYLQSSKDLYERLNPYFLNIVVQLTTSFSQYTLPNDLYPKLAQAFNIKNRGDVYSIELLLTIGKLKPLLTKKRDIPWSTIEKDIIRPLIKKHRAEHYSSTSYTLDTIPDIEWFPPFDDNNLPEPWYMNIALAFIRYPINLLRYDEFEDMYHIEQKNGLFRIINSDNIVAPLLEILNDTFYGKPVDDRHFRRAIGIIRSRKLNEFHSCKDYVDQFEEHYDPTYDWVTRIVEKLAMEDSVYNREVARMLPIGVYQRLYSPGCFLKRLISLNGPQRCGKSPFLEALAIKKNWLTDFNVFKEKNLVTRYAALKGKIVNEYAEREDQRKIELEHFKAFISATKEFRRPLYNNNGEYVDRWFDTIATSNEDEYNYDIENTRDWGANVGVNGRKLDIVPFDQEPKLLGSIIYHVKHGMSGAPSESVYEVASKHQESRVERTDLMDALDCCWALAHIDKGIVPEAKIDNMLNKYQVGYRDDGEWRTYGVS